MPASLPLLAMNKALGRHWAPRAKGPQPSPDPAAPTSARGPASPTVTLQMVLLETTKYPATATVRLKLPVLVWRETRIF